jgi:hypothetical protein
MSLPLFNNFTGAASGTTITTGNSGGTYCTAFNTVSIGSSAVAEFSNTHTIYSTGSLEISTPATATSSYVEWSTALGTQTGTVYFRIYLYFTAYPSAAFPIITFQTSASAGCASIWLNSSGMPYAQNAAGGGSGIGFTNAINLNAWTLLEGYVTPSTTTGVISISLYDNVTSATPTETHSASSLVLGANIAQTLFGVTSSVSSIGPFWMANVLLSSAQDVQWSTTVAATTVAAGVMNRIRGKTFASTVTASGYVVRGIFRTLLYGGWIAWFPATPGRMVPGAATPGQPAGGGGNGGISVTASVTKQPHKPLVSIVDIFGAVKRQAQKPLTGTVAAYNAVTRFTSYIVTVLLVIYGSATRNIRRTLVGITTAIGVLSKSIPRLLAATIVIYGSVIRNILKLIPPEPINVVQYAIGNNNNTGGYSLTVTLPNNTTAGNCLVACVAHYYTPPTSIATGASTDNWENAVLCNPATTLSGIYIDPNCLGGQNTVTINFGSTGAEAIYAVVYEVSGLSASPIDQTDYSFSSTGTSWSSGTTGVTSQPSEIAFGIAFSYYLTTFTGPSNWINTPTAVFYPGAYSAIAGYLPIATEGTQTYSGTSSASSTFYNAIVTLKGALPNGAGVNVNTFGAVSRKTSKLVAALAVAYSNITRGVTRTINTQSVVTGATARTVDKIFSTVVNIFSTVAAISLNVEYYITVATQAILNSAITRRTNRSLVATVVLYGTMARFVARTLSSTVNITAATAKMIPKDLAGVIIGTGSVVRKHIRTLSGMAVTSGALIRGVSRPLTGTVATAATITRSISRSLAASVAALSILGVIKAKFVTLMATAAVTATATRAVSRSLSAITTVNGSMARRITRTVTTTVVSCVSGTRDVFRTLMATAVVYVSVVTSKSHLLIFQVVALVEGTMVRKVLPNIVAVVILSGVTTRSVSRAIQGTFVVAGQTLRITGRVVSTVIVATVTIVKQPKKLINTSAVITVSAARRLGKTITAIALVPASFLRAASIHLTFITQTVISGVITALHAQTFYVTLTSAFTVTASVATQVFVKAQAIIFKYGISATRWLSSSVTTRWKSGND